MTEKVQFELEPNYPPSIESAETAQHPLSEVIVFDVEDEGLPQDINLQVLVRDANVEQTLRYQVFVNGLENVVARGELSPSRGSTPGAADGGMPPDADVSQSIDTDLPGISRELDVSVQTGRLLVVGCHRIELRVTSDFAFDPPANPRLRGDLATAVWWVFTKSDALDEIDPLSCPKAP